MQKNILIIEDDKFFRQLLANKLEKEGFAVEIAVDGEEGESKIYEKEPDLILLDMILPEKQGMDILQDLQRKPLAKKPVIIVLSNVMTEEDIQKAKSLGADYYFVKAEVTPNELIEKIKSLSS